MSMSGDSREESLINDLCIEIVRRITENIGDFKITKNLSELGLWTLGRLPNRPKWSHEFFDIFNTLKK